MENSRDVCSACNAPIKTGSKFCTECGKPVEDKDHEPVGGELAGEGITRSTFNCPECNAELTADDRFCTECGTNLEANVSIDEEKSIKEDLDPITNCPKCNATIAPGTSFCTECGTNIYEYKPSEEKTSIIQTGSKITEVPQKAHSSSDNDPLDNIIQDVEKTGRGLMKDLGGLLDKSSKKSSEKTIKPARKDQKFLVCDQ